MKELSLKAGVFITISKVDTTRDLRYSKVFVSVFPEKEKGYALRTLACEKSSLQRVLHHKLHLKPLPKLGFVYDPTEENAQTIEHILSSLHHE